MYGQGIAKGLWVTFKHFFATFTDDIRYAGRKYMRQDNFEVRQGLQSQGAFTVQYPDEKLAVPERFRFVPFLVIEDQDPARRRGLVYKLRHLRKVCPPQCIWIVRGSDPNTGRPAAANRIFHRHRHLHELGFARICPFDAIKMDHDYELASYDRTTHHIHDKQKPSKPQTYWRTIARQRRWKSQRARRLGTPRCQAMKKAGKTAEPPTADNGRRCPSWQRLHATTSARHRSGGEARVPGPGSPPPKRRPPGCWRGRQGQIR
jgi:NADH-quinone oxidoreductase subunit I